ncbi:MAG: AAA family ATPase [Paenibacillaceae bacterium]
MLIEFSVENFRSFKDKVTLSLVPSTDKSKNNVLENYFEYAPNKKLLRTAVIYGANASGKTNTLKALSFMKNMVIKSHSFQKNEGITTDPFKLHPASAIKPSIFDVQFISNGIRYAYGFKLDKEKIIEEYLYYWPNERQSVIFERRNVSEYKFVINKARQNTIKELTADNILYFSNAYKLNFELVVDAYRWFNSTLNYNDNMLHGDVGIRQLNNEKELLDLAIVTLEIADLGIKDLKIKEGEMDEKLINAFPQEIREMLKEQGVVKATSVHNVILENDETYSVEFNWQDESRGTRKFLNLIVPIIIAIRDGDVLCIDELDVSLHPKLTEYLLGLFHDKDLNKKNAQLIFTTHDTNLLNQDLFRRDQIWLTEKNSNTGSSDLYSLVELKIRNDENIEKGYLSGRYGAIPFIKGGNLIG